MGVTERTWVEFTGLWSNWWRGSAGNVSNTMATGIVSPLRKTGRHGKLGILREDWVVTSTLD